MRGAALSLVLATLRRRRAGDDEGLREVSRRTLLEAADLADRNGLYYPFMEAWIAAGGRVPSTHLDRWAREQADRTRLVRTLELLNHVQRRTQVDYAVIKDSAVPGSVPRDVDILVPPETGGAFLDGLESEGLVSVFDNEAEHSFAGPDTLRIDVYNRIHYVGRDFLPLDFLWSSRVRKVAHGVEHPGLDPSASFLVNSIHGVLGHARVSMLDFLDLCSLRDTLGDLSSTRVLAATSGWPGCFDRWVAYIEDLRKRVAMEPESIRFPVRHGHRLIWECVSNIEGGLGGVKSRGLFDLSLLWDDLVFYSEDVGLTARLRRSRIASAMANAAGHRLRIARGDRKGTNRAAAKDMLGRTRTRFR